MAITEAQYHRAMARNTFRTGVDAVLSSSILYGWIGGVIGGLTLGTAVFAGWLDQSIVQIAAGIDFTIIGGSLVGLGLNRVGRRRNRQIIKQWQRENPEPSYPESPNY